MKIECHEEHYREHTCLIDRHELQLLVRDAAAKAAGVSPDDLDQFDWQWGVEFEDDMQGEPDRYKVGIRARVRLIQSVPLAGDLEGANK